MTVARLSVIRSAFAFALFLAWLLPCSFVRADDSFVDDSFEDDLESREEIEFDSETLQAVTNFARSVSGVNATQATVDDNVAAILALLQSVRQTPSVAANTWFRTNPYYNDNYTIGAVLNRLFSSNTTLYNNALPSQGSSYLYMIQRALYGKNGSPVSHDAINPTLLRMESLLEASTNSAPQDLSWTNYISNIASSLSALEYTGQDLSSWRSYWDVELPLISGSSVVLSNLLSLVFESSADNASSSDPALRVVDPVLESLLDQISQTLGSIGSDVSDLGDSSGSNGGYLSTISDDLSDLAIDVSAIEDWTRAIHFDDLNYSGTDRSVQDDFLFLQKQIGVWNPSPTNNLYHLLSRLFDDAKSRAIVAATGAVLDAEIATAERSADDATTAATNVVARTAEEEPDWDEHKYTADNPLDTGDSIFALPAQQARSLLPTLPESTHKEIVLFRGNFPLMGGSVPSGSRASNGVLLDISYPLTDFDDVSSGMSIMRDIMEWVWELCSCVLCVSMLFRFYASLATDKLKMESEAAMGV